MPVAETSKALWLDPFASKPLLRTRVAVGPCGKGKASDCAGPRRSPGIENKQIDIQNLQGSLSMVFLIQYTPVTNYNHAEKLVPTACFVQWQRCL